MASIVDLLLDGNEERFIVYVDSWGQEKQYTHGRHVEESKHLLYALQRKGIKQGDYLILSIDEEDFFFKSFWACFLGGIIPVPISSVKDSSINDPLGKKLSRVWEILGRCAVLCTTQFQNELASFVDAGALITYEELLTTSGSTSSYVRPVLHEDTLAMIQFSSGSTGEPKGVMLTHKNILSNANSIVEAVGLTSRDVIQCWVPHTHDMGIIGGHFCTIYAGAGFVKMSPSTFLKKPNLFLELIHKYSVTTFATPNFGLDWLVKHYDENRLPHLRLDSIRNIFNGSEPVSVEVMESFIERFAPNGFNRNAMMPVYGLAEATLGVTFSPNDSDYTYYSVNKEKFIKDKVIELSHSEENILRLVSVGTPIKDVEVKIVSEDFITLEENKIGAIFIRGKGVTKGYINSPELNDELIKEGWLNTGDVGFMRDGNLVICDRAKNMACINGLNIFFKDLEEEIYLGSEIKRGDLICISDRDNRGQEELILFLKYKGDLDLFLEDRKMVRKILSDKFQLRVDTVIPVRQIPKTTSGKPQRQILKQRYALGEFVPILKSINERLVASAGPMEDPLNADLKNYFRKLLAETIKVAEEEIGDAVTFSELGMSSLDGIRFLNRIERETGLELDQRMLMKGFSFLEFFHHCKLSLADQKNKKIVAKSKAREVEEPISIIGMSCKFPGADSIEAFKDNLISGKSFFEKVSDQRKDDTGSSDWEDYLAEVKNPFDFDARFFSISEEEATFIDPQQRICLELAYDALLDAGIIQECRKNSNIGVFIGASYPSYTTMVMNYLRSEERVHPNAMANNTLSMIATRISKYFGLKGPSLVIDTACSSSLVALDMALRELRAGRIDKAIVGGVNLIFSPQMHALGKSAGILSPDGCCRVFDEKASGTVLGEGAGIIVLEKESERIKANRNAYATIIGSAVNNDGEALSIMAPNAVGQSELIHRAILDAGVQIDRIHYIEAHGTATSIGDPVEIKSLNKVFGNRTAATKCLIGSVKSSIGHLLAAAGIAGVIKTALSLRYQIVFPTVNISKENSLIDFQHTAFKPARELLDQYTLQYAGVSSFGFGGTNAHVILQKPLLNTSQRFNKYAFSISWQNDEEKVKNIDRIIGVLEDPSSDLYELCANSLLRTEPRGQRKLFLPSDKTDLANMLKLEKAREREPAPRKIQVAGLVLSGTISSTGDSNLDEIFHYLDEDDRNNCLSIIIHYGNTNVFNTLVVQIAYFYMLRRMCPEVKLFAADEVGRFLKESLEAGCPIQEIIKAYGQKVFLHEPVFTMEAVFPVIGFITKQDQRTNNMTLYAQIDPGNNSPLQVLKFFHEQGLALQWQNLYSLNAVMNWNFKYHPYTKKTYLLQPQVQFHN